MPKLFNRSGRYRSGRSAYKKFSNRLAILRLGKNRKKFHEKLAREIIKKIYQNFSHDELRKEIERLVYKEERRMTRKRMPADPKDELGYWQHAKKQLISLAQLEPQKQQKVIHTILEKTVARYLDEIGFYFKKSVLRWSERITDFTLRLLSIVNYKTLKIWKKVSIINNKIHIAGETDMVKSLSKTGTVILLPTHVSHLDSILIGWVIAKLKLPPYTYCAGTEMFSINLFAYIFSRLGSYKIDRRKNNVIYLETITHYTKELMKEGCHTLFYPGGTRSRSGSLEEELKLGLLSTCITAQRELLQEESLNKIFIVPVILSYHSVLEAPSLIEEYLQRKGQEKYYMKDNRYTTSYKILKFIRKMLTMNTSIHMNFAPPMDVLGNRVDAKGNSLGQHTQHINIREYFLHTDSTEVANDEQKENFYKRMLAQKVLNSFYKYNKVLSSHLVAFVAFEMFCKKHAELGLFDVLRLPVEELILPYDNFVAAVNTVREVIFHLKKEEKIDYEDNLTDDIHSMIKEGVFQCGLYHDKRPLKLNKKNNVITPDIRKLYYYHNRLSSYGLEEFV